MKVKIIIISSSKETVFVLTLQIQNLIHYSNHNVYYKYYIYECMYVMKGPTSYTYKRCMGRWATCMNEATYLDVKDAQISVLR